MIVEHNMDVIKCADHVIDLGPEAGDMGGEVVFEGHSLRDAWDGTFKGKQCSPGVYGWTCTYKSTVGSYTKSGEERGKITLIR